MAVVEEKCVLIGWIKQAQSDKFNQFASWNWWRFTEIEVYSIA